MKVTSEAGRKLFKSMGFKKEAVDGWTDAELVRKMNLLPQKYEKGKNDPKDKESKKLLKDILSAVEDDEEEVTLDKKGGKSKGKGKEDKKGGKSKKGKKSRDEDDEDEEGEEEDVEDEDEDSDDDEDESDEDEDEDSDDEDEDEDVSDKKKKGKKGKKDKSGKSDKKKKGKKGFGGSAGGPGKPGITQTIKDTIVKYDDKKKPLTKEKMLDILERKFPDRERTSMATTVYSQLAFKLPLAGWPIKNLGQGEGFYMTGNPPKGGSKKSRDEDDDEPKKGKKKGKK